MSKYGTFSNPSTEDGRNNSVPISSRIAVAPSSPK